jgi:hypothetical protein
MVVRHAWAAEVQGTLDFPHADGIAVLKQEPVDFPSFASKLILKLSFVVHAQ